MKKLICLFLFTILFSNNSFCQYIQDSRIDSIVNLISQQNVSKYMRELTGDTTVMIGGINRLIFSRYYTSPANNWAAQYIYEKFQSFGLNAQYQVIDSTCKNVLAVKIGTKYPNQKYIIGAHYDNIIWPINPGPLDTVHGADDNASGVCGVLEAARLLANMSFPYTIIFAAWDEEELGLLGSTYYADSAYNRGDSIKAYFNMDMITWNYNNQNYFRAGPDSNSTFFIDIFTSLKTKYIPLYTHVVRYSDDYGTDQVPFVVKGYRTFNVSEYNLSINPNYHKITDTYSNADLLYCVSLLKPTIAMFTTFALNKTVYYQHKQLLSSYDTLPRIATAIIKFPNKLTVLSNAPRLYYKANNEPYSYVNAYYNNLDTFKFLLPGKPRGSSVSYYFAAQDSIDNFVCTYPVGGSGLNPPGTTPPQNPFNYQIYMDYNQCSNTLPKPISDLQYTYDTIPLIQNNKLVNKIKINLNINHPNDGDVLIQLKGPNGTINLSQNNGNGGANYINTTFDDSALTSITQGIPPFTGSFKPQSPLSYFNNQPASANWVLRIFDTRAGNTGTLASWCILMQLKNNVSVKENNIPLKFELSLNYPNPFNPTTNIKYRIANNSFVSLKIYDVLGKEVTTLVNEKQNAGEYLAVFNGSGLSSGVYFYKLTCVGQEEFTDIKKMLMIK
jgi:subtilisin-like proprotein convertase family protein